MCNMFLLFSDTYPVKKKKKKKKNLHLFQRCREELFIESTAEAVNPANLKH